MVKRSPAQKTRLPWRVRGAAIHLCPDACAPKVAEREGMAQGGVMVSPYYFKEKRLVI